MSCFVEPKEEDDVLLGFAFYLSILPPVPGLSWFKGFWGVWGALDLSYLGQTLSCLAIRSGANFLLQ